MEEDAAADHASVTECAMTLLPRLIIVLTAATLTAAPAFAQFMRADDWYRLTRVSDVQFAPDAKTLAYVSTRANRESQRHESQIWLIAADGRSEARLLTSGFLTASQPRYSVDGNQLAFLGSKEQNERPQIYVAPAAGGGATRVTNVESGVVSFVWAPDGRRFAIVSRVGKREVRDDPLSGVTVVKNLHFSQDGRGLLKDQRSHVFIVDVATGAARQVTDGDFDHTEPTWSPDGKWLAFTSDRTGTADNGGRNTDVFVVPADGGTPRKVSPHAEANGSPAFSPDGKSIAFTGVATAGGQSDIYVMPVEGGAAANLTEAFDERVQRFTWTSSGIYFTANMQGELPLFKLDVNAKKVEKVPAQQGVQVTSFSLANDGALAVTRSGFRHPADVFVGAPGAAPNRHVTDVNRQLLSERTLAPVEAIKYKADDGLDIQGWLVKPMPFDPARKYPMVLRIHGGPAGMYGTNFDHEVHTLSARGYAVLFINRAAAPATGRTSSAPIRKTGWARTTPI
jgi:dipeptidyl aminopeptidase/acylaminoacyl peptidase